MKRFLTKVLLLTLLCCGILLCVNIFVFGSQFSSSYSAVLLDKLDRLNRVEEPKIILAGHSALAFGIRSDMMEEALGMPVVNLGLHGALGNAFHEEIAKCNIRPGDIVVLSHSTFSDDGKISDCANAWMTIDAHFELLRLCSLRDMAGMLAAYPTYFQTAYFHWKEGAGEDIPQNTPYSRYSFNEYGDVMYKPRELQMDPDSFFAENAVNLPEINRTCVDRINRLNAYVTKRGATLVIAGYPIAYGDYSTFSPSEIQAFESELREVMDCDVISDYTDYFYPYRLFYDTTLHLTQEGAVIRTQQLISELEQWRTATSAP